MILSKNLRKSKTSSFSDGIVCSGSCNNTFIKEVECKWTNNYHFDTALLLSVFLGMFGADRFYLGYPALGLLKFSTLGFFFIGHLVDIILIATQTLEPADGSHYVINYFGAGKSNKLLAFHCAQCAPSNLVWIVFTLAKVLGSHLVVLLRTNNC